MAERRETGRPGRPARGSRPAQKRSFQGTSRVERLDTSSDPLADQRNEKKHRKQGQSKRPRKAAPRAKSAAADWSEGERIAKYLARAGVGSRRDCESLIEAGKVSINGERLHSPAVKVMGTETIRVGRKIIRPPDRVRLWRYHKPAGLITTTSDPAGRTTIFDQLPKDLPRVVTIGRLDLNTEGLLLLTNDGALARALELPRHAITRHYRARAYGRVDEAKLDSLKQGITVDGERFGAIAAALEQETGANNWLSVALTEGKKREVRRALDAIGLTVNRLIRVQYGPFELGNLRPGAVEEVPQSALADLMAEAVPDFEIADAPDKDRPARSGRDQRKRPGPPSRDKPARGGSQSKPGKLTSRKPSAQKSKPGNSSKPPTGRTSR